MTPRRDTSAAVGPDIWLLAVSLAAGLGTARLTRSPGAAHVVVPIAVTVVAGHVGASVARRLRFPVGVVVAAGLVSVVLATVWSQLLSATVHGLPTPTTWRILVSRFDAAGAVIRSHPTPVPATHPVVLCIATGAGLVAVLGGSLWAWCETRRGGALVALVPSFGLFCYTALLSSQIDRVQGVVSYVVGALGFVVVADRATGARARWERNDTARAPGRRVAVTVLSVLPTVAVAALAVVVPLAASPALATLKVDALPFPEPPASATPGLGLAAGNDGTDGLGGNGGGGGPAVQGVQAIDLVDNLRAVLVNRTGEVMFSAQSTMPTYWQVAVLTEFDGTAWLPDPTTEAAAQSFALSPQSKEVADLPALPQPPPTKTFSAVITIGALESTLLPLPPTTVSVDTAADFVPGFGVVQPVEAPPGATFTAVARVPVNPTTSDQAGVARRTSSPVPAASLAPYLKLPVEPARVIALAHQIVAGARSPAARAAALARWFNSGRYRYTLSPPAPKGSSVLQSFLFTTKAGFCQQFAAAYGVLARIDGLPTRVAVGFTTGQTTGRGRYRVTGSDAHVWPEVYLGPSTGWTSYEPTPASSGEATGVGVNSGSKTTAQGPGSKAASAQTTLPPQRRALQPKVSVPTTAPLSLGTRRGAVPRPHPRTHAGLAVAAAVTVLVALVAGVGLWMRRLGRGGWSPLAAWRRHRRRRRHALPDPTAEVLAQWHEAAAGLERARLGRGPAETLEEHAARLRFLAGAHWLSPYRPVTAVSVDPVPAGPAVGAVPGTEVTIEATVDAYARLTALAGRASYGSGPCTEDDAVAAARLGATVRSGLARPGNSRGVLVSS